MGHRKVTVTRYVVETLFIILDRYVKLYIYLTVLKLYMLGLWRFSVIALNCDVSGRSHFTEIISYSFTILSSVESTSIPCKGSIGRYQKRHFFWAKIANVTHLCINLHIRSA